MKGEEKAEEEEEDRGDKYVEAAAAAEEVEDSVPLDRGGFLVWATYLKSRASDGFLMVLGDAELNGFDTQLMQAPMIIMHTSHTPVASACE